MIKTIIVLVLMQSMSVQADVVHQFRFCKGKFCAINAPLTLAQQLELNQQFEEGNLSAVPAQRVFSGNEIVDNKVMQTVAANRHVMR